MLVFGIPNAVAKGRSQIVCGRKQFDSDPNGTAVYVETGSSEANVLRTLVDARLCKAVRDLLDVDVRRFVLGPKGFYSERAVK